MKERFCAPPLIHPATCSERKRRKGRRSFISTPNLRKRFTPCEDAVPGVYWYCTSVNNLSSHRNILQLLKTTAVGAEQTTQSRTNAWVCSAGYKWRTPVPIQNCNKHRQQDRGKISDPTHRRSRGLHFSQTCQPSQAVSTERTKERSWKGKQHRAAMDATQHTHTQVPANIKGCHHMPPQKEVAPGWVRICSKRNNHLSTGSPTRGCDIWWELLQKGFLQAPPLPAFQRAHHSTFSTSFFPIGGPRRTYPGWQLQFHSVALCVRIVTYNIVLEPLESGGKFLRQQYPAHGPPRRFLGPLRCTLAPDDQLFRLLAENLITIPWMYPLLVSYGK